MSQTPKPVHASYAYQQIAEEIEARILRGELKPGDQLPGESELGAMFGVTRSTVREGLRQLESDGLVHRPSPRRLEVTVPQADQLTTRAGRAMALMKVTFRKCANKQGVIDQAHWPCLENIYQLLYRSPD